MTEVPYKQVVKLLGEHGFVLSGLDGPFRMFRRAGKPPLFISVYVDRDLVGRQDWAAIQSFIDEVDESPTKARLRPRPRRKAS